MPGFRTILFAADFSENSSDAFRIACALAARDQGRLVVLHVVDADRGDELRPSSRSGPFAAELEGRMRALYVPDRPIEVAYRTSEGAAAAEILLAADEVGADLIAMGTHGRTGWRRLLAGSVAAAVIREARRPVMALYSPEGRRLPDSIRVVFHPIAMGEDNEYILRLACALASNLEARLVILHVSPRGVLMSGALTPGIERSFYNLFLERVRRNAEESDVKPPAEIRLTWGNIVDEILSQARGSGCDLIVMGTHRRSLMARLLMGSEARAVLRRSDRPILFVKAPQAESPTLLEMAVDEATTTPED